MTSPKTKDENAEALASIEPEVRAQALLRLSVSSRTWSGEVLARISWLARFDPDRVVRMMACAALRWAPAESAVPILVRVIRDRSEMASVRAEAMEALSYQPREAVPKAILLFGLRDSSPAVRFFAAYTAGELGAASTKGALERMAETDPGSTRFGRVRTKARIALRRLRLLVRTRRPSPPR
jgi:HEAT repeat protein